MRGAVASRSRLRGNTTRYIGMSRFFGTVISKWFAEAASSKVHTHWGFAHTPSRARDVTAVTGVTGGHGFSREPPYEAKSRSRSATVESHRESRPTKPKADHAARLGIPVATFHRHEGPTIDAREAETQRGPRRYTLRPPR